MGKELAEKNSYRLPPCPSYDVEGTESWLGDMAEKGLFLTKDGFFAGVGIFRKGPPRRVRYRLEAAQKSTSMWADDGGEPDEEAVEVSGQLGWEYVCKRGEFYVYCSESAEARELNTDPQIQALALEQVRKRERGTVISCLICSFVIPLLRIKGNLVLLMLELGTWYILMFMGIVTWLFAGMLYKVIHLGRLRRRLRAGGTLDHRKDWKKRAALHRARNFLLPALLLVFFCLLPGREEAAMGEKIPLEEEQGDMPFPTMRDFVAEEEFASYTRNDMGAHTNTVRRWTDWLAPAAVDWRENATIRRTDGTVLSGGLSVDYYEMRTPWLAREVAQEYARMKKWKKNYEPIGEEELGIGGRFDYAAAYYDEIHMPNVVIQQGCRVIHVTFYQVNEGEVLPVSEWAGVVAAGMAGESDPQQ